MRYDLLLVCHCEYSSVGYRFSTLNDIMTLKSGLEVTQGHSNWYHSKAWVQFPSLHSILTVSCILHRLWDKAEILVENRDFFIPPCIRRPHSGVPSENCHPILVYGKTRTVKKLWGYVLLFRHNTGVWRTDGQTSMHTHHAVKIEKKFLVYSVALFHEWA